MSIVTDLRFRVVKIRVWDSSEGIDGVQFVFRHYDSHEERLGELKLTSRARANDPPTTEVELVEGEFLVAVSGLLHQDQVTQVRLSTSSSRSFICGGRKSKQLDGASKRDDLPIVEEGLSREIRKITPLLEKSNAYMTNLSADPTSFPELSSLQSAVKDACAVPQDNVAYKVLCALLCENLHATYSSLSEAVARGIVVPVAALFEFEGIVRRSQNNLSWCQSYWGVCGAGRRYGLEQCIQACKNLQLWIKTRIPVAELANLEVGAPVRLVTEKVAQTATQQLIESRILDVAAVFYSKQAAQFCLDSTYTALVKALISSSHARLLYEVVTTYAVVKAKSVEEALVPFKREAPILIEKAISSGRFELLELLVLHGELDPFQSPQQNLDSEDNVTSASRAYRCEYLMDLAGSTESEDDRKRMKKLLVTYKNHEHYQKKVLQLAQAPAKENQSDVVTSQLLEIIPMITQVYDLSVFYSLSNAYVTDKQRRKELVLKACDHILDNKLVREVEAHAYMKAALRYVLKDGLLTEIEFEKEMTKADRVQIEGADWVRDMNNRIGALEMRAINVERQLAKLQHTVGNLREELLHIDDRHGTNIGKIAGIYVSQYACALGVPLIAMAAAAIGKAVGFVDMSKREDIEKACFKPEGGESWDGKIKKVKTRHSLRPEFSKLLTRNKIDVYEFLEALTRLPTVRRNEPVSEPQEPQDPTIEVVGTSTGRLYIDKVALAGLPYFGAVRESRGDVEEFYRRLERIPEWLKVEPSAKMRVDFYPNGEQKPQSMQLQVDQYAKALGYPLVAEYWVKMTRTTAEGNSEIESL